jgi:uncharacterized NAD-dependent epimerase/dehydratase family protein
MPRYLVYAEGQFGSPASKTGNSVVRYSADKVAAVLDSKQAGKTAQDVLGFGGNIPVVASIDDAISLGADSLLIGIATHGGGLPADVRKAIHHAIDHELEIWNGLHTFVGLDPDLSTLARIRGVKVHDVRRPPDELPVGTGRVRELDATVLLAVGTDANIGKMTVMLQLRAALAAKGVRAGFAPTGQTGIFIEGWGLCVDAVVADFIAGAAEEVTFQAARDSDIVLVEGQGSILHPGYSGVSLGLLHGSLPHGLIACHQPTRQTFRHNAWLKIPPLRDVIDLHERIAAPLRPAKTIGVSLNTVDLSEADALAVIEKTQKETGLPTTDPVRFDTKPLVDAVIAFDAERRGAPVASARR